MWFPPQRTHRLAKETDKKNEISLDGCRSSQEGKHFRDSNISFYLKPWTLRKIVITSDSILLHCPPVISPTLTLPFSQHPLTSLQTKTMAPNSNILAQSSKLIPDHMLHVSEIQSPDAFILTFTPRLRLSAANQKALLPRQHFLIHPNLVTFKAQSKYNFYPLSCLLLLQWFTFSVLWTPDSPKNLHSLLPLVVPIH